MYPLLLLLLLHVLLRVRFQIIGNARIENVGKYQSCIVSKLPMIWKQTVISVMGHNAVEGDKWYSQK